MATTMVGEEPPAGPWDDAELVVYSADVDHAEDPNAPYTPRGEGTGAVSFSLWARFEDEGTEIPIYVWAETGVWMSLDAEQYHPDPATPVSDAFVEAVVNMVAEEVGNGWGDPTEETFEAMTDVEKQLWGATQWSFLKMDSAEAAMVIDWCQKQAEATDDP